MGRPLPILSVPPVASPLRPDGKRNLIVPADVEGRYTRRRRVIFALLIAVYVLLPWVEMGGHPALFLDVQHRAFYLFGATFNAQDSWLAFFLLSGIGFALIVATALWGRVWCGYACPQTVFLEGVFRRVERLVEGSRGERLKRDAGPITFGRVARKVTKHAAYLVFALLVAHVFLSYFVSLPALFEMVRQRPSAHPEAFAWAFGMTGVMYFNFAWFREQLCLIVCPYGRLQSVLTDNDSLVIAYDAKRGEPRGKAKAKGVGACVDCNRCVVVCPTGIDIRNGLQMDCIGCAACIDACDDVMTKLKRPTGLIRYDSQNGLSEQPKRLLRPRIYVYAGLGLLGLVVASFGVRARTPFEANLLRLQGAPFVLEDENRRVRNAVELHLVNKHGAPTKYRIEGVRHDGLTYVIAMPELELGALESRRVPVFVSAPNDGKRRRVQLRVDDGAEPRLVDGAFVAP